MATVNAQKRSGAGAAKSAMFNPNGLLSQKLCHYLNQGRTLNDILMRAAHSKAYFDLSQLNLAQANMLKGLCDFANKCFPTKITKIFLV